MSYKDDILERVRRLELPQDEYIVVGGAVMALHNIRPAGDIDILISSELFEQLRSSEWTEQSWTKPGMEGKTWLTNEDVEVSLELRRTGLENLTFDDLRGDIQMVEGIPFMSLNLLVEFKTSHGREKDFADLALIESYLKS